MKIGDVVRLKSGGPAMTVDDATYPNAWSVAWFVGGELHRDAFEESELEAVPDPSPGHTYE